MSDLAPFVAAILRDKSIADLMEENASQRRENDSLRGQLHDLHTVKVTGANGIPVYASANLNEDGKVAEIIITNDAILYMVKFAKDGKVQKWKHENGLVRNLEVHIGALSGSCIETISHPFHKSSYHPHVQYGSWTYHANGSSALRLLSVLIGPFTSEVEYDGFDLNDATNLPATNIDGKSLNVFVAAAAFEANHISHLIDNFEQRLQQAQAVAAARAAAQAVAAARPPTNVDENE